MKNIDLLIEQYKKCNGLHDDDIDIDSASFLNDFFSWCSSRRNIGKNYFRMFLTTYGVNSFSSRNAEVGKCGMDSIFLGSDTMSVISPYVYKKISNNNNIFVNSIKIIDGKPYLVDSENNLIFVGDEFDRFTTYNPYSTSEITDWSQMCGTNIDFTVGVYGTQADKDRDEKIEAIKRFRNVIVNLTDSVVTFEDTRDNLFAYGISTTCNNEIKRRLSMR